jgi:hypothetical protein
VEGEVALIIEEARYELVLVDDRTEIASEPEFETGLILVEAEQGPAGPAGPQGEPGVQKRWYGEGPPGVIIGASPGNEYVDTLTGDLYVLR